MFYMLLLEYNTTKKEWMQKISELDPGNKHNKKYKIQAI